MRTNGSSQRWRPTGLEAGGAQRGYRKEVTLCAYPEANPDPSTTIRRVPPESSERA